MDKFSFTDRSIFIPIGISVFSIMGILTILLNVYLGPPQAVISATPTPTPFKYLLLSTATFLPGPAPETNSLQQTSPEEPAELIPADTPQAESRAFPTETSAQANTPAGSTALPGPTATPAASATASNAADKYDDVDALLEYDGDWVHQTNVGNAYQGTLSVSSTIDDDLIFDFTGQQIVIGYLGGSGQGILTIYIDDDEFQLNQSTGREWTSPQFTHEEHFVIIVHESGASVNLDYINVLGPD